MIDFAQIACIIMVISNAKIERGDWMIKQKEVLNLALIKTRRKQLGLSQEQVANGIGMPSDKYSRRENGKYKFQVNELPALSRELKMPVEKFFN